MPQRSIRASMLFACLFVLLMFLHRSPLRAQDIGEADRVWIPEIVQDTLANGVRVLFSRVNSIPLAEISILVDAGLSREDTALPGLAHLTARMLIKGSADRDEAMISRRLDQLGSYVTAYTHYDYAQLYGKTLRRNFRSTLEIMADAVVRPTFPSIEIDRFRQEASRTMLRMPSSAGEKASARAIGMLCGPDHVLTRPLQPEVRDFEDLTRENLEEFHAQWYRPERCTVIISGDLDYTFVRTLLREVFGRWERGETVRETQRFHPVESEGVTVIDDREVAKGLAYVRIAVPTSSRNDMDMPALVLLNSVLGESDSSRLRLALWGEQLISPSFSSALGFSRDCGYLMISGSVSPQLADSVVIIVDRLLAEIAANGVTSAQLERAKARLLLDSPLTFASNRNLLGLLREVAVYEVDLGKVLHFTERIRQVSREDINRLAARLFQTARRRTVVLGDADKLLPGLHATGRKVVLTPVSQD
ncbi:MAG: pitrilysin family protein [Bacteroidota bacterium]|nr:pitrilysin family protein [Bacteroidota bacterium]